MKDYKRLTKWSELGTLHVFDINGKEIPLCDVSPIDTDILAGRLADFEDKIESGEIDYVSDKDAEIACLTAENAALRERLDKAVELPCKVGDTIYEVSSAGIREWLVTSIELLDYGFKANCEGKNDFKLHWHFVKTDCCNDFEGKGRIRVTREAAEARLAEMKGGKHE